MATRKPASKWDVPAQRGAFDHLLAEIRDEAAKLTPAPPSDPPRQPRVHVAVEVVQRPPQRATRRWTLVDTLWLVITVVVVLVSLAGCTAHAQPFHYQHWQDTNGAHGEVRQQGRTTDWTSYGPHGELHQCHQYFVGDQPYTTCN